MGVHRKSWHLFHPCSPLTTPLITTNRCLPGKSVHVNGCQASAAVANASRLTSGEQGPSSYTGLHSNRSALWCLYDVLPWAWSLHANDSLSGAELCTRIEWSFRPAWQSPNTWSVQTCMAPDIGGGGAAVNVAAQRWHSLLSIAIHRGRSCPGHPPPQPPCRHSSHPSGA